MTLVLLLTVKQQSWGARGALLVLKGGLFSSLRESGKRYRLGGWQSVMVTIDRELDVF